MGWEARGCSRTKECGGWAAWSTMLAFAVLRCDGAIATPTLQKDATALKCQGTGQRMAFASLVRRKGGGGRLVGLHIASLAAVADGKESTVCPTGAISIQRLPSGVKASKCLGNGQGVAFAALGSKKGGGSRCVWAAPSLASQPRMAETLPFAVVEQSPPRHRKETRQSRNAKVLGRRPGFCCGGLQEKWGVEGAFHHTSTSILII